MSDEPKVHLQKLDTSVLLDIWLDGFTSGCTTAFIALKKPDSEETADAWADEVAKALANDPACMETIRNEIKERLLGIEGSPHTITAYPLEAGR